MLLENKQVAIIGAGPVGLTMARLLQQKGVKVTVYERDQSALARISGGTLDLHKGSGQEAMKKAGLIKRYYELALPMGRTVADAQGHVLFDRKPLPGTLHDNPEINRNDLRTLLLDSLTGNTVVWNSRFTELEARDGKWVLHFENGTAAAADLVIGANGGMSKARAYVTDAKIEYTGTLMIQGEVLQAETACPAFFGLCNDNILMAANGGNMLVANPKNGGLLSYNVIFENRATSDPVSEPGFGDIDSIKTSLLSRFADWHECYKQLFRETSSFVLWPTRKIPLKPWNNNRALPITLIGDAAHIMPPFAGKGVNTGLLDALILADNLTGEKHEAIEAAIADYEQQMFVYAAEAQSETNRNEIAMRDPGFSFLKFYQ